jgi:hypothetical protein
MASAFDPQFHTLLRRAPDEILWLTLPRPCTLVSYKERFHHACQREERARLDAAGATVLMLPISM